MGFQKKSSVGNEFFGCSMHELPRWDVVNWGELVLFILPTSFVNLGHILNTNKENDNKQQWKRESFFFLFINKQRCV